MRVPKQEPVVAAAPVEPEWPYTDEQTYAKIDRIVDNLDVYRIHKIMRFLNWTWTDWRDSAGKIHYNEVPSETAIAKEAKDLLMEAYNGETYVSTGGFTAEFNKKDGYLGIYFSVAEGSTLDYPDVD